MQESSFTLDTADGVPVHVWHWEPDEGTEVVGVVQVAHGLAEHAARYRWFAEQLTADGWVVLADDHRGHGRTAASDDDLGFLAASQGWATVLDDLHRLTTRARELHPDLPVVLFGHSMGSFLAQQYLFTFPGDLDAAVLSGTNGPIGLLGDVGALVARVERRRVGARGRSNVLHALGFGSYNKPFEPARTEVDWLSRDEAQVDAYVADPWCGFVATTQLWLDLLSGLRVIADTDRLAGVRDDLPILLVSGAEDPVGGTKGVEQMAAAYRAAGCTDVTVRLYEGARHELVNEVNRDEVLEHLRGWLRAAVDA